MAFEMKHADGMQQKKSCHYVFILCTLCKEYVQTEP
jgi:hypothetical protein